jgi:hypothetical protein
VLLLHFPFLREKAQRPAKGTTDKRSQGPTPLNQGDVADPHLCPSVAKLQAENLPTNTETADDLSIAVDVFLDQIIEQSSSFPNQFQQTTPGVMILLMGLEMFREVLDPFRDNGNLDLG